MAAISISVDAPGQYGRIDIHSCLQAALHARQPVIHALSPVADRPRPICLSVWPQQQANGSAIGCSIEQASRGSTELLEQRRHLGLARKGAPWPGQRFEFLACSGLVAVLDQQLCQAQLQHRILGV